MPITDDILYVGVNDHDLSLFEGLFSIPDGVSYNSYLIKDEKIAVMDAVDAHFGDVWLDNIRKELGHLQPDFLIIHHMEPDHSASVSRFMDAYPEAVIIASQKAFPMMQAFFGTDYARRRMIVKEGDVLCLGRHTLRFISAPMVHWPEVMMTWDQTHQVLFTADAFGSFGAIDTESPWISEARRYYFSIVGKYGMQVQAVLQKLSALDIRAILPLHGRVLTGDELSKALHLYEQWCTCHPEETGVVITHASIYGNTRRAAEMLAENLRTHGTPVIVHDLTRMDLSQAVADAFRFDRLVLAASTYNADLFPPMRNFIHQLTERGYRSRTVGLIENGSWAPMAAKVMRSMLESSKALTFLEPVVTIRSALNAESTAELTHLADTLK